MLTATESTAPISRNSAAIRTLKRRALKHYCPVILPEIKRMLEEDNMSLAKIAEHLNAAGYRNTRGNRFSASLIHFVGKSAGLITT